MNPHHDPKPPLVPESPLGGAGERVSDDRCLEVGGAFLGDSDRETRDWSDALRGLQMELDRVTEGVPSPVNIVLMIHIDGRGYPIESEGIKIGRINKQTCRLLVWIEMRQVPVDDKRAHLVSIFAQAVAEAEAHVIRRRFAPGLPEVRAVVDILANGSGNLPATRLAFD
jgi:hypothetical protein